MQFLLLILLGTFAAQAEPLPLKPGNYWIYREVKTGAEFTVRVGVPYLVQAQEYHTLHGYTDRKLMVRYNEYGSLVWFNEEFEREEILTSFEMVRGGWANAPFRPCEQESQRQEKPAVFEGGAGVFQNAIELKYRSVGCADAGVELEQFADNIGMLRRVESSFAGPRTFDLVFARVGKTVLNALPAGAFTVSAAAVEGKADLEATLRYVSNSQIGQKLRFPTSQEFEIVLRDENGAIVFRWSDGQVFDQSEHERHFADGWTRRIDIPSPKAGTYTLEAWLPTRDSTQYASAVAITIL